MIKPESEIEYPPSRESRIRATMLARMEELNLSSKALMTIIAARLGAEKAEDTARTQELTAEQQRLIENMRTLVRN